MSKVIGGIFCLVGTLALIFIAFLYGNSSFVLNYNDPALHKSMLETGFLVPTVIVLLMVIIGYTFMFKSDEPNLK